MKSFNLTAWAIRHNVLAGFFLLAISVAGLVSYLQLGRSEDPDYTIKVVNLTVRWPGASARQMRDQVADPIEKKLRSIPWFDHTDTFTTPGSMSMQVWVRDDTPSAEVPKSFYQIRKKLLDMAGTLPAGVQGPFVNDEFGDVDSILLAIQGKGADYRDLDIVAKKLQRALLQISAITKVQIYGAQDQKIFVEYQDDGLATLAVQPEAILAALKDRTSVQDAGTLDNGARQLWPAPSWRSAIAPCGAGQEAVMFSLIGAPSCRARSPRTS